MKPLSLVKKAVAGALAAGSTLLIAACYGAYSYKDLASGQVTVPEGTPNAYNVMVCAEFGPDDRACAMVDPDGRYWVSSSVETHGRIAEEEGYELCAGDEAGVFIRQCVTVPATTAVFEHNFDLEFTPGKK